MTKLPGEGSSPITSLHELFAPYPEYSLDTPGSEASIRAMHFYQQELYQELDSQDTAFALGSELGDFMVKKAILELYELHGTVVSRLMGEDKYREALLKKAEYDALPPGQKATRDANDTVPHQYKTVSEMVFWYLNNFSPTGMFAVTPTTISSIHATLSDKDRPTLFDKPDKYQIEVISAHEDGTYLTETQFDHPGDPLFLEVARVALGFGMKDNLEKGNNQPALDLLRANLAASEPRRLDFMLTLPKAESLFLHKIARLEVLRDLEPHEMRTYLVQEFEAYGIDNPFDAE